MLRSYAVTVPWESDAPYATVANGASSFSSGDYSYAPNGLIRGIGSMQALEAGSIYRRKEFLYDPLGRLVESAYFKKPTAEAIEAGNESTGGSHPNPAYAPVYREVFAYDTFGNMRTVALHYPRQGSETVMAYETDANANRLLAIGSAESDGYRQYDYDDNGNLVAVVAPQAASPLEKSLSYNQVNQLVEYSDETTGTRAQYLHSPGGLRLFKAVDWSGTGTDLERLYTLYDGIAPGARPLVTYRQSDPSVAPALSEKLFYSPKGLAYKENWKDGAVDTTNSTYIVPDHLGSTHFVINAESRSFQPVEQLAFGDPLPEAVDADLDVEKQSSDIYGELELGSSMLHDSLISMEFAGHPQDMESGFNNMQLRSFSSEFKRFLTPDPVEAIDWENPQSLNLYVYVGNNPMNLMDPTGGQAAPDDTVSPVDPKQVEALSKEWEALNQRLKNFKEAEQKLIKKEEQLREDLEAARKAKANLGWFPSRADKVSANRSIQYIEGKLKRNTETLNTVRGFVSQVEHEIAAKFGHAGSLLRQAWALSYLRTAKNYMPRVVGSISSFFAATTVQGKIAGVTLKAADMALTGKDMYDTGDGFIQYVQDTPAEDLEAPLRWYKDPYNGAGTPAFKIWEKGE